MLTEIIWTWLLFSSSAIHTPHSWYKTWFSYVIDIQYHLCLSVRNNIVIICFMICLNNFIIIKDVSASSALIWSSHDKYDLCIAFCKWLYSCYVKFEVWDDVRHLKTSYPSHDPTHRHMLSCVHPRHTHIFTNRRKKIYLCAVFCYSAIKSTHSICTKERQLIRTMTNRKVILGDFGSTILIKIVGTLLGLSLKSPPLFMIWGHVMLGWVNIAWCKPCHVVVEHLPKLRSILGLSWNFA